MENEEWKDVVGYEGLYQVSNLGNVRMLEHYTPYVKGSVMKIPAKNLYIGWSMVIVQYGYVKIRFAN